MAERPAQRALVAAEQHVEDARSLAAREAARSPSRRAGAQDARAHHRRRRQRHGQRDQDRDRQRDANSRNRRPTMPPISRIGMNTATSDRLIDSTVKPTSRAPWSAACEARHAGLDVARDVLEHDDRVVDDEAGRDRQRHQRQVVEAVAQQIHDAERADQRHRHGDARDRASRARCAGTGTPPG